MLPNGEEVATGFGSYASADRLSFYQYGVGPSLTHLFTQSNYGVVLEGVINLMPRQPFTLYLTTLPFKELNHFLSVFSKLVRKGLIGHSLEIDSQNDPKIFELFENEKEEKGWIVWFVIYGDKEIRQAKNSSVINALSSICSDIKTYDSEVDHTSALPPIKVRLSRYKGKPNDHSLISTAKAFGVELDNTNPDIDLYKQMPGFRCVLPVIPFSKQGGEIIDFIYRYSEKQNQNPVISVIALDSYTLEVFARVHFNRQEATDRDKAADWSRGLLLALKEKGIYPYRLDIENMTPYLSEMEDSLLPLKNAIKNQLDPNGIISPGRYHLIIYS